MRTNVDWICAMLVGLLATSCMSAALAAPPTPSELAALAPRLSSNDPKPDSFQASGFLSPGNAKLGFAVTWRRPDRCAIRIVDASDDTPLFWVVDGHALLYNALDQAIEVAEGTVAEFVINDASDRLNFNFGFRGNQRGAAPYAILIDVKSIVASANLNVAARALPSGGNQLSGLTARGSSYFAEVDPAKSPPFADLRIFTKDDPTHAVFALEKIQINPPDDPDAFRFPSRQALEPRLRVHELKGDDAKPAISKAMASIAYRVAIRSPEARDSLEKQFGKIDWPVAAEKDAQTSAALRQAMKDAPVVKASAK